MRHEIKLGGGGSTAGGKSKKHKTSRSTKQGSKSVLIGNEERERIGATFTDHDTTTFGVTNIIEE